LEAAGYASEKPVEANEQLLALVNRAADGTLEDADDLSFLQRNALRLVEQTNELLAETGASNSAEVLSGLRLVVIVNKSNHAAIRKQLSAVHFPGKIYIKEQQEFGGVSLNDQGHIQSDNTTVFPEGHGEPFIAIDQQDGFSYELNADGSEREISGTLRATLLESGVRYRLFGQVSDLNLLDDMLSLPRWKTALASMQADGSQMVLEMVENSNPPIKGGGAFGVVGKKSVVLRDTLAMKNLPNFMPENLSRMLYVDDMAAAPLTWDSLPTYLTIRAGAGIKGVAEITREQYSGDASSARETRAMVQKGLQIQAFKQRTKIPLALERIGKHDAEHPFVKPVRLTNNSQHISVTGSFAAFVVVLLGTVAFLSGYHWDVASSFMNFMAGSGLVLGFGASMGFLAQSAYLTTKQPHGLFHETTLADPDVQRTMSADDLADFTAFAKYFGLTPHDIKVVPGEIERVDIFNGERMLIVGSALLYDKTLRRLALKHAYWHFKLPQLSPNKWDRYGIAEFLNEIPVYPLGLLSFLIPYSWLVNKTERPNADFAGTQVDRLVPADGRNIEEFKREAKALLSKYDDEKLKSPQNVVGIMTDWNGDAGQVAEDANGYGQVVNALATIRPFADGEGKIGVVLADTDADPKKLDTAQAAADRLNELQNGNTPTGVRLMVSRVAGTDINAILAGVQQRAENINEQNTVVVGLQNPGFEEKVFVAAADPLEMAVRSFVAGRYSKDAMDTLTPALVKLLKDTFPELEKGHFTQSLITEMVAAIMA
jgi:hypothetical protein